MFTHNSFIGIETNQANEANIKNEFYIILFFLFFKRAKHIRINKSEKKKNQE